MVMASNMISYYENYTPVGDVLVMAFCMVFMILIQVAYINRTRNFLILKHVIFVLFIAALSDILYHILMNQIGEVPNILIYLTRGTFYLGLFANLWLYVMYVREPLRLEPRINRLYFVLASILIVSVLLYEIFGTLTRIGFYIDEQGTPHTGFQYFPIAYFLFLILVMFIIIHYRNRIFRPIIIGIIAISGVSVLVIFIQQIYGQSSFTAATFLFPAYALLYLVHANPYDLKVGSVNESAFEELIRNSYEHKSELLLMSLYLKDFDGNGRKYPPEIQEAVRSLSTRIFKQAALFQISGGHMILVADTAKNPDYNEKSQRMLDAFAKAYDKYRVDYKIVFTKTFNRISAENDYIGFIRYIQDQMSENMFWPARDEDVKAFLEQKYILRELADIQNKQDLNDPRVEVYCQPVYNISTGTYDTAEALMRLRLQESGMIFPERFIPIAEKNRFIHTLTKIILHKTCEAVRELVSEGYRVKRISVNFSVFDIRERDFCKTVEKIIGDTGISFDKIAVEITESQNAEDFAILKEKIDELKDTGIKFYLDDFGTGYSNFERIMELPFDIIKFNRSMVVASGTEDKIREMVSHLARMFADMDYAVLYEGVESDSDEKRCSEMSAKYLQGYRYSRPIPIERLREFFVKKD